MDIDSHVENTLRKQKVAFRRVKENTEQAAREMIQRQEEGCRETGYANGQSLWVTDHTAQAGGKRKLGMRYKGPGKVSGSIWEVYEGSIGSGCRMKRK